VNCVKVVEDVVVKKFTFTISSTDDFFVMQCIPIFLNTVSHKLVLSSLCDEFTVLVATFVMRSMCDEFSL